MGIIFFLWWWVVIADCPANYIQLQERKTCPGQLVKRRGQAYFDEAAKYPYGRADPQAPLRDEVERLAVSVADPRDG